MITASRQQRIKYNVPNEKHAWFTAMTSLLFFYKNSVVYVPTEKHSRFTAMTSLLFFYKNSVVYVPTEKHSRFTAMTSLLFFYKNSVMNVPTEKHSWFTAMTSLLFFYKNSVYKLHLFDLLMSITPELWTQKLCLLLNLQYVVYTFIGNFGSPYSQKYYHVLI